MVCKVDTDQKCAFASHGKQAVEMVKESTEVNGEKKCGFDLILMDCQMPIMDGYEASTMIREYLYELKIPQPIIVACTGHTEKSYV